jgi:pterin-4a-carbinolamine dehydratase
MQLRSALSQQQIQQQQVRAGQLANQQTEEQLKSQKAFMQAYSEAGGDIDKTIPLAAKYGAHPDVLIKLKEAALKAQTDNLDLLNKKGARALQEADLMQGAHDAVTNAKPQDKPAVYQQQLAGLQQYGIDVSSQPPQYPGDEAFKFLGLGIKGHKSQLEELAKQAEIGKTQAETSKFNAEAAGGVAVDKRELNDWLAKNPGKGPAEFAAWKAKLVPQFNFNLQNTASPNDIKDTAQSLADGSIKWSDILAARTPLTQKIAILKEVKAIKPDYSSGDFAVEQKMKEAFTSGSQGQQLTAINTAREHMATFKQTADALGNGNFLLANRVGQALGMQFGQDQSSNFQIARAAFAGEVGKAFAGANVAEGDRRELLDKINLASSPAQLKGYADTADKLLEGKQKSLKESYQQGIQAKPNFGNQSSTGKAVSLAAARQLPAMQGKTDDEIKSAIQAAGHQVIP